MSQSRRRHLRKLSRLEGRILALITARMGELTGGEDVEVNSDADAKLLTSLAEDADLQKLVNEAKDQRQKLGLPLESFGMRPGVAVGRGLGGVS